MVKEVVMSLILCLSIVGCTNTMIYIKTDNRAHNSGCHSASDGGDGLKIGLACQVKSNEEQ